MEDIVDGKVLRIYVGEDDEYDGRRLYEAIVRLLPAEGLAGATVFRGIMGYGASSRLHHAHVLRLSEDLPMVIECVDRADRVDVVLPHLNEMITEGLVTVERPQVHLYRAAIVDPPTPHASVDGFIYSRVCWGHA